MEPHAVSCPGWMLEWRSIVVDFKNQPVGLLLQLHQNAGRTRVLGSIGDQLLGDAVKMRRRIGI